jgi:hypothetical protein
MFQNVKFKRDLHFVNLSFFLFYSILIINAYATSVINNTNECNFNEITNNEVNVFNCTVNNKDIEIKGDWNRLSGIVEILSSNVTFKDAIFSNITFFINNSNVFFEGVIENLSDVKVYNSNLTFTVNVSQSTKELSFGYFQDSLLTFRLTFFSDVKASLYCNSTLIKVYDSKMENLKVDGETCFFYVLNSLINNKKSFMVFDSQEEKKVEGDYFYVGIQNSKNVFIKGSFEYFFVNNSSNITISDSEIKNMLYVLNSSLEISYTKFKDEAFSIFSSSQGNITKSIFCSDKDFYIKALNSSINVDKNYYRDIKGYYLNGFINDTNSDYFADTGLMYPYKSEKFIGQFYDYNPIIAEDVACVLREIGKQPEIKLEVNYDCYKNEINIYVYSLIFPTTANVLLVSRTSNRTFYFTDVHNISINLDRQESADIYDIIATKGGYKDFSTQVITEKCVKLDNLTEQKIEKKKLKILMVREAFVQEKVTFQLVDENNNIIKNLEVFIVSPYNEIRIVKPDENGFFSFFPSVKGSYKVLLNESNYILVGNNEIEVKEKGKIFKKIEEIKIKEETTVTIGPEEKILYDITIKKENFIILEKKNVDKPITISLKKGNYIIEVSSSNRFSKLIVNHNKNNTEVAVLDFNNQVALFLLIFFIIIFLLSRRDYKYQVHVEIFGNMAKGVIKDFYGNPIKERIKVLRNSDVIYDGYPDDYGIFNFVVDKQGIYEIITKNYKIKNGVMKIDKIGNEWRLKIIR